jgi:hypothetical protein
MDLFGQKPKIKKMLASEKMEHANYPLQLHKIRHDGIEVILKDQLTAEVNYEEVEKLYYITYPDLGIIVWEKERPDADEAFQFAFVSLVQNFYYEDDANLTPKAREVKKRLSSLIEQIK